MGDHLDALIVRQQVVDVVIRYATGVDRRDWVLYAGCFTDPCRFDFSSFTGRPAVEVPAATWADNVRRTNGSFDATQHLSSNHVVTMIGDGVARCVSEMQAQHYFTPEHMAALGDPGAVNWCTLGGHYTNRLVRIDDEWRIRECHLAVRWTTGNPDIFRHARAIGAALP